MDPAKSISHPFLACGATHRTAARSEARCVAETYIQAEGAALINVKDYADIPKICIPDSRAVQVFESFFADKNNST
jgi:hypothetical protein